MQQCRQNEIKSEKNEKSCLPYFKRNNTRKLLLLIGPSRCWLGVYPTHFVPSVLSWLYHDHCLPRHLNCSRHSCLASSVSWYCATVTLAVSIFRKHTSGLLSLVKMSGLDLCGCNQQTWTL